MQLSFMTVKKLSVPSSHEYLPRCGLLGMVVNLEEQRLVECSGAYLEFYLIMFFFFARRLKIVEAILVVSVFFQEATLYDSGRLMQVRKPHLRF